MQVFMPYPDLRKSVSCLDPKRLGNQIYREAKTLISGWPNHPAARIWVEHKHALAEYALYGLEELQLRGRHYPKWRSYFTHYLHTEPASGLPPIIGYEPFHAAHRSQLLQKEIDDLTWIEWQRQGKPNYLVEFSDWLPDLKSRWKKHSPSKPRPNTPDDFDRARTILNFYPTPTHYGSFGWTEEPGALPYIWTPPRDN